MNRPFEPDSGAAGVVIRLSHHYEFDVDPDRRCQMMPDYAVELG